MERGGRLGSTGEEEPTARDTVPTRDSVESLRCADQAAADDARRRFRRTGLTTVPVDEQIGPLLAPGEHVVAVRHEAWFDRRQPEPGGGLGASPRGRLYVTSRRLVLVGRPTLSFELQTIEEAVLSGELLLLIIEGGQGVAVRVSQPRLLWVEIATARAAARTHQSADAP